MYFQGIRELKFFFIFVKMKYVMIILRLVQIVKIQDVDRNCFRQFYKPFLLAFAGNTFLPNNTVTVSPCHIDFLIESLSCSAFLQLSQHEHLEWTFCLFFIFFLI